MSLPCLQYAGLPTAIDFVGESHYGGRYAFVVHAMHSSKCKPTLAKSSTSRDASCAMCALQAVREDADAQGLQHHANDVLVRFLGPSFFQVSGCPIGVSLGILALWSDSCDDTGRMCRADRGLIRIASTWLRFTITGRLRSFRCVHVLPRALCSWALHQPRPASSALAWQRQLPREAA